MKDEEIEKQAEEMFNKHILEETCYVSNPDEKIYSDGFSDGAKWGKKKICEKILEEVENKHRVFGIAYDWGLVKIRLEEIIKELGVDL